MKYSEDSSSEPLQINHLIRECKDNLKIIQKDFSQLNTHISKILSKNGLNQTPKTPIVSQKVVKFDRTKKKQSRLNYSLNESKFQPDFASTPNYKLPKTSTPILIGGSNVKIKKTQKKSIHCKRLVFSSQHHNHHHHHHQHCHHNCRREAQLKHYFIDSNNDFQSTIMPPTVKIQSHRNSCIVINKTKYLQRIINKNMKLNGQTNIQHNHYSQEFNLLSNLQLFQFNY